MFIGTGKVDAAYVGSSAVSKIYLGSTKVWPLSSDWTLPTSQTLTYTPPADQYSTHQWDMSQITGVDTGEKWQGLNWDRMSIHVDGGLILQTGTHTITLGMLTDENNPGAGQNTGFNTFRFHASDFQPYFNPRDVTLNRVDATYSAIHNSAFGYWTEEWVWDVSMTRSGSATGSLLTTTGIYQ